MRLTTEAVRSDPSERHWVIIAFKKNFAITLSSEGFNADTKLQCPVVCVFRIIHIVETEGQK